MITEKERLHFQLMEELNFKMIERLSPSSTWVYKVEEKKKIRTIKIADTTDIPGVFGHVLRENVILQKAGGIPGVVQQVSFHERVYKRIRLIGLVREYVDGEVLHYDGEVRLNKNQQPMLEATVRALHEMRIVDLDIKGSNIVIEKSGVPYLIDLGTAKICPTADYTSEDIRRDLSSLNLLFRRYGL